MFKINVVGGCTTPLTTVFALYNLFCLHKSYLCQQTKEQLKKTSRLYAGTSPV
jgi:hypothetical protein